MSAPECARCGVTVNDLPYQDLGLDYEEALDVMFDHDGSDWYCNGCFAA